jgi:hypothetical protein
MFEGEGAMTSAESTSAQINREALRTLLFITSSYHAMKAQYSVKGLGSGNRDANEAALKSG